MHGGPPPVRRHLRDRRQDSASFTRYFSNLTAHRLLRSSMEESSEKCHQYGTLGPKRLLHHIPGHLTHFGGRRLGDRSRRRRRRLSAVALQPRDLGRQPAGRPILWIALPPALLRPAGLLGLTASLAACPLAPPHARIWLEPPPTNRTRSLVFAHPPKMDATTLLHPQAGPATPPRGGTISPAVKVEAPVGPGAVTKAYSWYVEEPQHRPTGWIGAQVERLCCGAS